MSEQYNNNNNEKQQNLNIGYKTINLIRYR